ncbi:hypothetical protein WHI96_07870 [Pseudonocardia tropica]|uniref:Uncharacterized protein n=1 Tax=Pseudonocardia tropica TaxID=681289 RepID=A0ABV1JS23_9PSEU
MSTPTPPEEPASTVTTTPVTVRPTVPEWELIYVDPNDPQGAIDFMVAKGWEAVSCSNGDTMIIRSVTYGDTHTDRFFISLVLGRWIGDNPYFQPRAGYPEVTDLHVTFYGDAERPWDPVVRPDRDPAPYGYSVA